MHYPQYTPNLNQNDIYIYIEIYNLFLLPAYLGMKNIRCAKITLISFISICRYIISL